MSTYDSKSIRTHTWPAPQQLPDGRWRRTWTITLRGDLPQTVDLEAYSSNITKEVVDYLAEADTRLQDLRDDLTFRLHLESPREVIASMLTRQADWPDELLFAAWRMFEDVDQLLGTIETIDGQARDNWPPWNRQPYHTKDVREGS